MRLLFKSIMMRMHWLVYFHLHIIVLVLIIQKSGSCRPEKVLQIIVYLPRKEHLDRPAIIIELKWDKSADSAIRQIKERNYPLALSGYCGNLLMVGINYNTKTKMHECVIEKLDM